MSNNTENELTPREIKQSIKTQKKFDKKDKCFKDKNRICDPTCKSHSHNEAFGGIRLMQWWKKLLWKKGECKLLKALEEDEIDNKELTALMDGKEA